MIQILLNTGYSLSFLALAVRDILWLRTILISAQLSLFSYAVLAHNTSVAVWNLLFLIINLFHVIKLVKERQPIELLGELSDIYENVFKTMSKKEFLYFWHLGSKSEINNRTIIKQGERQEEIALILAGSVDVIRNGDVIARLARGSFIAEMSFLTNESASADVEAKGQVQYISWKQEKLRDLKLLNPNMLIKIQNILGKDLTQKIKVASDPHS